MPRWQLLIHLQTILQNQHHYKFRFLINLLQTYIIILVILHFMGSYCCCGSGVTNPNPYLIPSQPQPLIPSQTQPQSQPQPPKPPLTSVQLNKELEYINRVQQNFEKYKRKEIDNIIIIYSETNRVVIWSHKDTFIRQEQTTYNFPANLVVGRQYIVQVYFQIKNEIIQYGSGKILFTGGGYKTDYTPSDIALMSDKILKLYSKIKTEKHQVKFGVIGKTGIGKTTFIYRCFQTLIQLTQTQFLHQFMYYANSQKGVSNVFKKYDFEEGYISIVDTPGYGGTMERQDLNNYQQTIRLAIRGEIDYKQFKLLEKMDLNLIKKQVNLDYKFNFALFFIDPSDTTEDSVRMNENYITVIQDEKINFAHVISKIDLANKAIDGMLLSQQTQHLKQLGYKTQQDRIYPITVEQKYLSNPNCKYLLLHLLYDSLHFAYLHARAVNIYVHLNGKFHSLEIYDENRMKTVGELVQRFQGVNRNALKIAKNSQDSENIANAQKNNIRNYIRIQNKSKRCIYFTLL